MLDAGALVFLRLGNRVPGAPQRLRFCNVLGDHGIRQLTGLEAIFEKLAERFRILTHRYLGKHEPVAR